MPVPDGNTGDFITPPNAATGTGDALAMRLWRLRVGWLGQAFNVLTGGWWCRAVLADPKPTDIQKAEG